MKNINENVINKMKKIVKDKQAMKIDGVLVDLYTASAVTQIYDKVNPANKKKMEKMSPQSLQTAAFKILGKKESVSEDASGMNPKQKMKFDQLMKKLDGGKEHLKFKRMAKNSVQGDDMFHGYVKDLAMKESVKISFHSKGAKTKWMKKQGVASKEIINQTPTSIELPSRWKDLSKKKDHDEIFSVINEAPKPFGRVGPPIPKPSQVRSAISRVKKQLMKKYKQKGGYENFGQKELEKMKTQFNYNPSGEPDEREIAKMLRAFDDWAMDYDGDMREGYFNKELESGQYVPGMEKMYVDIIKKNGGKNIKVNKPNRSEPSLSIDFDGGNTTKMEKEIESKGDGTETLDESVARARADARRDMGGRGAQRGMAPLKKDVDNDATDGDRKAASKHIIQQLRKAADLPNGAEVEFKNGKGKVDRNSAQMVLKKYLAMKKPMDKEKFQSNIKSLADIKKILGR